MANRTVPLSSTALAACLEALLFALPADFPETHREAAAGFVAELVAEFEQQGMGTAPLIERLAATREVALGVLDSMGPDAALIVLGSCGNRAAA